MVVNVVIRADRIHDLDMIESSHGQRSAWTESPPRGQDIHVSHIAGGRGPGRHEHSSIPSRKDSMVVNVVIRADRILDLDRIESSPGQRSART